jgi:hypothetical protein
MSILQLVWGCISWWCTRVFQWIQACCSCKVLWTFLICHVLCCYLMLSEFSCCFQKWNRNSGCRFCIMICTDFYCIRMCPHSLELMTSVMAAHHCYPRWKNEIWCSVGNNSHKIMNPFVRSCGVHVNGMNIWNTNIIIHLSLESSHFHLTCCMAIVHALIFYQIFLKKICQVWGSFSIVFFIDFFF